MFVLQFVLAFFYYLNLFVLLTLFIKAINSGVTTKYYYAATVPTTNISSSNGNVFVENIILTGAQSSVVRCLCTTNVAYSGCVSVLRIKIIVTITVKLLISVHVSI